MILYISLLPKYIVMGDYSSVARVSIIGTKYSRDLAAKLAEYLEVDYLELEHKKFPDGEVYVRIPVDSKLPSIDRGVIVSTGYPSPSERLLELLLAVEALRGIGVPHIIALLSYAPYARQDRRFLRGEPISIRVFLGYLSVIGVNSLAVVDIHKPSSLVWFSGPSTNVYPAQTFAEKVRSLIGDRGDVYVVAPDRGALWRAKRLAEELGAPFDYMEKTRDRVSGEVDVKPRRLDVGDVDVVLVDDIISTGGTIARASRILYDLGAQRVYVVATHCLLVGGALEKLVDAGVEKILCSNTVMAGVEDSRVEYIDISREVGEVVRSTILDI